MNHLLNTVPRWANGAISHRESNKELWADSVYMVQPSLAYWAVKTDNATLLDMTIEQCNLYHGVLGVVISETEEHDPWGCSWTVETYYRAP